jgi:hypothetical protein
VATSRNLQQLATRMRLRALQVADGVDKVVRTAAFKVDQAVVMATPVDTGRARSNWIASIGSPTSETRGPHSPGAKLGRGESNNAQAAINAAKAVIDSRRFNQSIFISNNLDYIGKLNNGSSKQAPKNFVRQGVQAGTQAVRSIKIFEV